MPSLGIVPGAERTIDERLFHGSPGRWGYRWATNECELPPLDIGVQAIQLSPYRSGVARPQYTHLLLDLAFQPCACPLALSGLGQAVASESSALNSGPLRGQFTPCVTRRTLSPHTAHERGILWERSISPAPRCIPHGQLCAFAGYLCTVSQPSPSGPSPCARFSRTRTPMPYLTAWRALEFRLGFPMPTLHPPCHPLQALPCSR